MQVLKFYDLLTFEKVRDLEGGTSVKDACALAKRKPHRFFFFWIGAHHILNSKVEAAIREVLAEGNRHTGWEWASERF